MGPPWLEEQWWLPRQPPRQDRLVSFVRAKNVEWFHRRRPKLRPSSEGADPPSAFALTSWLLFKDVQVFQSWNYFTPDLCLS